MDYPCITLHTKDRNEILWSAGYEAITDPELKNLFEQCRHMMRSLENELAKRGISVQADIVGNYCETLREGVDKINMLERLDEKAAEHVKTAVGILTNPQTSRSFKIYQEFLYDVLRHCGCGVVLLCAAGLGKPKISALTNKDRVRLLGFVKGRRLSYSSSTLDLLARDYDVPMINSPKISHLTGGHRKHPLEDDMLTTHDGPVHSEDRLQSSSSGTTQGQAKVSNEEAHPNSLEPYVLPLTEAGAEIVLSAVQQGTGIFVALPQKFEWLPFIQIPYQIGVKIMQLYTNYPELS